ncbi:MAG TPA: TetR/AcrR family transcriptional regulator [Candidatus Gemmiger faecavium]|nr:TetR/AcrR family transcriptional regulator [Candidatus Gemmiger faecavium]
MDLRAQKTQKSITDAFFRLRAHKPLEKLTVRELCREAPVNRSTFYAYYKDVYDLSEHLENELVRSIVAGLPHPEAVLTDTARFTQDLFRACAPHPQLAVLFSGSRRGLLIARFSAELKRLIFDLYPERRGDPEFEVSLSFRIYGAYYAFLENRQYGEEKVVGILGRLSSVETF